jgi:hypothetical protein
MAIPEREQAATEYVEGGPPAASGWAGWVVFGGVILILLGCVQAIEGLVALFDDQYFVVRSSRLLVHVSYTTWGWVHLILGIVAVLAGFGLLAGNLLARVVGVGLAFLSALAHLAFVDASPVWSVIVIALDILVIYAIVAHGRELKAPSYY